MKHKEGLEVFARFVLLLLLTLAGQRWLPLPRIINLSMQPTTTRTTTTTTTTMTIPPYPLCAVPASNSSIPNKPHSPQRQRVTHVTRVVPQHTFDDVADAEAVADNGPKAEQPQRRVSTVADCKASTSVAFNRGKTFRRTRRVEREATRDIFQEEDGVLQH